MRTQVLLSPATTIRGLCALKGYPTVLVDPLTGVARDPAWRDACWLTAADSRRTTDIALGGESEVWIACGRAVAGVRVEMGVRADVERLLGATPLVLRDGDHAILVYAAAEPILCARGGAVAVYGLASRIPAFGKEGGGTQWMGPSPLDVDVQDLPTMTNSQVSGLLGDFQPDSGGGDSHALALSLDRDFLVERLSSRRRLARLLLTRLVRGKTGTRSLFDADGKITPDSSCGLFIGPPVETRPGGLQRNPGAPERPSYAELARKTAANGYSVLAVRPMTKDPADKPHWRRHCLVRPSAAQLESWDAEYGRAGVGLACGTYVAAVDIDAKDKARADTIARIAREVLGETPLVRGGRDARLALIYRCDGPVVTTRWRDLEVLGLGTHILAYGIHPRTAQPYPWKGRGEPATVALDDVPAIGMADVERLMRSVSAHYGATPRPAFGPDARNVMPIVTSSVSISRLLFRGLATSLAERREAVRRLLDGRYAGTGSGLAIEWRDDQPG